MAKPTEALQAAVDAIHDSLSAALSDYETNKNTDRHADERRDLRMYLAELEPKVKQARERLAALESAPSPAVELANNIAELEFETSKLSRETQFSMVCSIATEACDQDFNDLSPVEQRGLYQRNSVRALQNISTPIFHAFSRLDVAERTVAGAKSCAKKIQAALKSITEALNK